MQQSVLAEELDLEARQQIGLGAAEAGCARLDGGDARAHVWPALQHVDRQ